METCMYQHILISTDGSEIAQLGLDHGLDLAKALNATATIITVTEVVMPLLPRGAEATAFAHYHEYAAIQKETAERVLAEALEKAREMGVTAEGVCFELGPPAEGIIQTAKERNCDLIVMSSHGRRGLRRLMLGSVASEVVGTSSIPVLIVR